MPRLPEPGRLAFAREDAMARRLQHVVSGMGLLSAAERWVVSHETRLLGSPVCLLEPPAHMSCLPDLSSVCAEHSPGESGEATCRAGANAHSSSGSSLPSGRPTGQGRPHTLSSPKGPELCGQWPGCARAGGPAHGVELFGVEEGKVDQTCPRESRRPRVSVCPSAVGSLWMGLGQS